VLVCVGTVVGTEHDPEKGPETGPDHSKRADRPSLDGAARSYAGRALGGSWQACCGRPPTNNDVGQSGALSLKELEIVRVKGVLDAAALVYAPEHGLLVPVAFYRARDGVAHQVCVNLHPEVGWRVIDLAATFVARLEGADDLRPSATACARDYARQCQLFHAGLRESPPI
jgi:hypothetical protein